MSPERTMRERRMPGWLPLALMTVLMLGVGGYAAGRNGAFYSQFNLNSLLGPSGSLPIAFVAVLALAVLWDLWLYRSPGGLTARAVGLDESSSRRLGAPSERINWRAFVLSSAMAALGGLFLAASVGIGDARPGTASDFAMKSIAAAVLGGASLGGGRGSFIGAVIGGTFLALIVNVLALENIVPGFLREWSDALPLICIGALTLIALVLYQAPELWARARTAWQDVRIARARVKEARP